MAEYVQTQTGEVAPPVKPETAGLQDINLNYNEGVGAHVIGRPSREAFETLRGPGQVNPLDMLSTAPPSQQPVNFQPPMDPTMRHGQAYAHTMPPAGLPARQVHEQYYVSPTAGRQYKMASDIFGTGMDRSWSGPANPHTEKGVAPHRDGNELTSFKITETANKSPPTASEMQAEPTANGAANRRTRESAGNPVTGLGYDSASTKTAKRYFEGSNANQKLW